MICGKAIIFYTDVRSTILFCVAFTPYGDTMLHARILVSKQLIYPETNHSPLRVVSSANGQQKSEAHRFYQTGPLFESRSTALPYA
jgi:hypothetical protein